MVRTYAEGTSVSVEKSRAEIESLLRRHGATGFISGWGKESAFIMFLMNDRQIKFVLPVPDRADPKFTHKSYSGKQSTPRPIEKQHEVWELACRERWRALALVIKAKLEAVAAGITIFEDEFLAEIVLPGGQTVAETIRENIAIAYRDKRLTKLLPDYS